MTRKKENHRINDAVAFLGAAIQIRTGDLILTKDSRKTFLLIILINYLKNKYYSQLFIKQ